MTVKTTTRNGQGAGIASFAADALSDLTRLALAGAERAELAARAARWLAEMVPGCRVLVVEATAGAIAAVVLADTAAGAHTRGKLALEPESALTQSLAEPSRIFHASGAALARSLPGVTIHRAQEGLFVSAEVADEDAARAVLIALADGETLAAPPGMEVALRIMVSHLAVTCAVTGTQAAVTGAHQAIGRAKLEWEGTVDALADVVCLLDSEGRIVRANRVVEQWGLGDVEELAGRTPHETFHPGCRNERCPLETAIRRAWGELRKSGPARFEYRADGIETVLHFSFRPMLPDATLARATGETLAVLVVSNMSELNHAREALSQLNTELEIKIRERTQELREANRGLRNEIARRKAAEAALRASHGELGILSEQLIVAQENERHRISRELHDSVGQSLSAIKYSLERAAEMLRRPGLGDPGPVLMQAIGAAQETAESISTIATNLRPSVLDDMGAASALAGFCRQYAEVYRSMVVETKMLAADSDIPDRLATAVFRSAQELLNNVAKHAKAKTVVVELRREPSRLILEVRDDGIGINGNSKPASPAGGHGIRNLRERAEMTGGTFALMPGPQSGTVARIAWQLLQDEIAREAAV